MHFVLASSGHIAGIINPPGGKGTYWTNKERPRPRARCFLRGHSPPSRSSPVRFGAPRRSTRHGPSEPITRMARAAHSWYLRNTYVETDRVFADGGHSLDFINKSFECLDLIGWQHAADLLPSVMW